MSDTDKTKPARVKLAQGERKPRRYPDTCAFWAGRDPAWQEAVKAESGRSRARLREFCQVARFADDAEELDLPEPVTTGTDWVVY